MDCTLRPDCCLKKRSTVVNTGQQISSNPLQGKRLARSGLPTNLSNKSTSVNEPEPEENQGWEPPPEAVGLGTFQASRAAGNPIALFGQRQGRRIGCEVEARPEATRWS